MSCTTFSLVGCWILHMDQSGKKSCVSSVLLAGSKMFVRLKSTRWICTSHIGLGTLLELWLYPEVDNSNANNLCFLLLLPTLVTLTCPWVIRIHGLQLMTFFYLYTFNLISSLFGLVYIFGWLEKLRSLNDAKAFSRWCKGLLSFHCEEWTWRCFSTKYSGYESVQHAICLYEYMELLPSFMVQQSFINLASHVFLQVAHWSQSVGLRCNVTWLAKLNKGKLQRWNRCASHPDKW